MNYSCHMESDANDLTLGEGICLSLVSLGAEHGYAIARYFNPGGSIGAVYSLSRPAVYREIGSLEARGLLTVSHDVGTRGQAKKILRLSRRGTTIVGEWLERPVLHLRDIRLDFLVKVILRDMLGLELAPFVRAQREQLAAVLAGLTAGVASSPTMLWRREQALAVSRFLDECETLGKSTSASAVDDTEPSHGTGDSMVVSARNQLTGKVVSVRHGSILSSVKISIDEGQVLTSTITREASDHLRLAPGSAATALFKATDVMVAVKSARQSRRSGR